MLKETHENFIYLNGMERNPIIEQNCKMFLS